MSTYPEYARTLKHNKEADMTEPASAAVSGAVIKYFGVHLFAGALAAALGFLVLWPKSLYEGFARLFITIVASSIFGPMLLVHLHSSRPELFASAQEVARLYELDANLGLLFIASPLLVIAGLPAWWLIGALVRLFESSGDSWISGLAQWFKRKLES